MVFKDTATRIGAVTGPLSMLVIGDSLAQIRLKDLFTDVRLLLFSVVKLLLMPALLLWGLRFFITDPMFLGVCLVMTATPVGSMTVMLAQQYDGDYRLTSKGVALTTVLSVATMPFLNETFSTGLSSDRIGIPKRGILQLNMGNIPAKRGEIL